MINLYDNIKILTSIGEKRAELYKKLGISSINDLLNHYPRRYVNFSDIKNISDIVLNETYAIKATVISKNYAPIRRYLTLFKVGIKDDTGKIMVNIFNNEYIFKSLRIDKEYIFYGKIEDNVGTTQMTNPLIIQNNAEYKIKPIYPATSGLSSLIIEKSISTVMSDLDNSINDPLPKHLIKDYNLCDINFAMRNIHFPESFESLELAKKRLIFDELFYLQMAIKLIKQKNKGSTNSFKLDGRISIKNLLKELPFTPTSDQINAIDDCIKDMSSNISMNRLIQGDVGSGKTLIAICAMFLMAKSQMQSCLMAPTEILAKQHYSNIKDILEPFGIVVALLTGSTKNKERTQILKALENGNISIIIGTHAVITDRVIFQKLALVVTDEQHRFGVKQRETLLEKSGTPHSLVMSATPIPRTLSLIIYGDLDVSIITEMPVGRLPIKTMAITPDKRDRAFDFVIQNMLEKKQQGYIVCPLIEETESNLQNVLTYAENITKNQLKNYRVAILHGKMKTKEKDQIMIDFKEQKYDILVSTTVIEVGIDIKNATFIIIENAERFGLSALHQLRGRVGRNDLQSYCILIHNSKSETTANRLKILCDYTDGFKIAEKDLKLRGPGDFFGKKQHGLPSLKIANLVDNVEFIKEISNVCDDILNEDPTLASDLYKSIKIEINNIFNTEDRILN